MTTYHKSMDIRWSDLDPNFHVRHSVYYDFGAFCRVSLFEQIGLTSLLMQQMEIGPILFREEAVFRRELRLGDRLYLDLQVTKARKDFSRWTIRHQLIKNEDILAATITVDGAWINTRERKLTTPPPQVAVLFQDIPRSADFAWHGL